MSVMYPKVQMKAVAC